LGTRGHGLLTTHSLKSPEIARFFFDNGAPEQMSSIRIHIALLSFVMTLSASLGAGAAGFDVSQFFTGKTITFIVGSQNATYARIIGRYMVKYIPGNPSMKFDILPGQASRKAATALARLAPGDGLSIAALLPEAIMKPLVGASAKKRRYDPLDFIYLGSASRSTYVCIADSDAPAKNFEQALEHGKIQGLCGYSWARLKRQRFDLVSDKKVNLILQFGLDADSELTKRGVPSVWKFVKDQRDRAALGLLASSLVFARPFVTAPGMPRAQVNALWVAFERTMRDVDFRSDAHKNQLNITPTTGDLLQRLIRKIYKTPADVVSRAREALRG